MDLRIAHLYPDLMNIYGDRGNVIALTQRAKWRGIGVEVRPYSVGEWADPEWPDVWFFGGGQDQGQDIVGADLAGKNGSGLRKSVEGGAAIERATTLAPEGGEVVVLATYTAMQALRAVLARAGATVPFWED